MNYNTDEWELEWRYEATSGVPTVPEGGRWELLEFQVIAPALQNKAGTSIFAVFLWGRKRISQPYR